MEKNTGIIARFFQLLSALASHIDDQLRFGDLKWNRTAGGLLDRSFGICRHSYHYLVLPSLIAAIIVMGIPEFGLRLYSAVAVFVFVFFLLVLLARFSISLELRLRNELILQVSTVLAVACIVWTTGENVYHKGIVVYRHFFIVAAFIVSSALIASGLLTTWVWSRWKIKNNYQQAATKTELFISRDKQIPLGWGRFFRSFLTVIQGAPLQLLLLPAVIVLMAPRGMLIQLSAGALLLSYGMLFMGGIDARLNQMWSLFQGAFFRGGTRWVSLIIIALAAARIYDVTYITTVFDTAGGFVIALLLLSSYVLLWWYDYWTNRLLAQELIKLLSTEKTGNVQIPYPISPDFVRTSVLPGGRVLQIHGASRFIVIGSKKKDAYPRFQAYSFEKMFESLASGGFPGGKASPSPRQIAERIFDYKCLAGTILLVLSLLTVWYISSGVQRPQLNVANETRASLELAQLLNLHTSDRGEKPALIISASGGGTRAALYTAAAMEGLAEQGLIEDVIMASGVSGGGAALSYFAGNRPALVESKEAWDDFFNIMSMAFIQDVINSAMEWRIVSSDRLGILLAESFARRWKLSETRNKIGQIMDFGLILNTAIAGRFTCDDQSKECLSLPFIQAERRFRKKMTTSELAGGRLILTNLLLGRNFAPSVVETGGPEGLPVVVNNPATRLEVAAALNANFPPVFSNAAVDIDNKTRYWVTDGGAVDNRGIEMMLYALRETLSDLNKSTGGAKDLPPITVIALDASAFSNTYSQDRGMGSMMGAGTQYASLLVKEQLQSIRAMYRQNGQSDSFRFIYVPMPLCLRESGSFGTHWMLQPNIKINVGPDDRRSLKGHEMVDLLRAMHVPGRDNKLSTDARAVLKYARTDKRWQESARKLGFIQE